LAVMALARDLDQLIDGEDGIVTAVPEAVARGGGALIGADLRGG